VSQKLGGSFIPANVRHAVRGSEVVLGVSPRASRRPDPHRYNWQPFGDPGVGVGPIGGQSAAVVVSKPCLRNLVLVIDRHAYGGRGASGGADSGQVRVAVVAKALPPAIAGRVGAAVRCGNPFQIVVGYHRTRVHAARQAVPHPLHVGPALAPANMQRNSIKARASPGPTYADRVTRPESGVRRGGFSKTSMIRQPTDIALSMMATSWRFYFRGDALLLPMDR